MPNYSNINANSAVVNLIGDPSSLQNALQVASRSLSTFATACAAIGQRIQAVGSIITEPFINAARTFANFDMLMRAVKAVTNKAVKELEESLTLAQQPSI